MPCLHTDALTHNAETQVFSIDASEFSGGFKFPTKVLVRSHVTGHVCEFQAASITRDQEGEVIAWCYLPVPETVERFPKLKGYELAVWND